MLSLVLPWPPSTNHYLRHVGTKILISAAGRQFRRAVAECCLLQLVGIPRPLETRLALVVFLYPPTHQLTDIDNRIKPLQDALQQAMVYVNDAQIDEIHLYRREIIAGGKAEVRIVEYAYEFVPLTLLIGETP